MAKKLYLNAQAQSPDTAFVKSEKLPFPVGAVNLTRGDNPEIELRITDGEGDFDSRSGDASYTLEVSIGNPQEEFSLNTTFNAITQGSVTNGWVGRLDLTTGAIANAIGAKAKISALLEARIKDGSGNEETIGQGSITIFNHVA